MFAAQNKSDESTYGFHLTVAEEDVDTLVWLVPGALGFQVVVGNRIELRAYQGSMCTLFLT